MTRQGRQKVRLLTGARYSDGSNVGSSWQIDQHEIRVLTDPIEHDVTAIRCDVERSHGCTIRETRELPAFLGCQVEHPEVLRRQQPLHVHDVAPARKKAVALALDA